MKVAQNDETNPITWSVYPPHVPIIANVEPFPSVSSVQKCLTPGKLSGYYPPSPVSCGTALEHSYRCALPCYISSCLCLHCIYCFFPLFSPVDYETDAAAAQFDYGVDDPPYLPEQSGKPPLDHQISPILLYTACIRVV